MQDETQTPGADTTRDAADAAVGRAAVDAGGVKIETPPESAREQAEPPGYEAAPIEGEASSRLMGDGGGASPTEDLRDVAFSGEEEGGKAPPPLLLLLPPTPQWAEPAGLDDFVVKPSGEIIRKHGGSGWDEYIEKEDVVGDGGEDLDDVAEADGDFFDDTL